MMKKILIAILLLGLLSSMLLLASCKAEDPASPENTTKAPDDSSSEEENSTEPPVENLIFDGGEYLYTLVFPDEPTEEFFMYVSNIADKFQKNTGKTVLPKSDFYMPGKAPGPEVMEILIGNCNREETNTVKKSLNLYEWTVRKEGNKIVVFGHNKETLSAAVDYFLTEYVKVTKEEETNVTITYGEDYTYTKEAEFFFGDENPLEKYVIVYGDKENKQAAKKLATRLKNTMKLTIDVVTDDTPVSPFEILVGQTNREECEIYADFSDTKYIEKVVGQKLLIGGKTPQATSAAVQYVLDSHLSATLYTNVWNYTAEYENLRAGADLRIMSWNILTEFWNDKVPVDVRDEELVRLLRKYMPDVIGFQEVSPAWYRTIKNLLGDEYAFITEKNAYGGDNYSTLAYRKSVVEVKEWKVQHFSIGAKTMRLVTWALFERYSDGEQFIVASTHWDTNTSNMTVHSNEMADIINALMDEYQVPIFCAGDYNRDESTEQYKNFINKTGFLDARYKALQVIGQGKSYHATLGESPEGNESTGAIDHILYSPGVNVWNYTLDKSDDALDASDHCPIIIDVELP